MRLSVPKCTQLYFANNSNSKAEWNVSIKPSGFLCRSMWERRHRKKFGRLSKILESNLVLPSVKRTKSDVLWNSVVLVAGFFLQNFGHGQHGERSREKSLLYNPKKTSSLAVAATLYNSYYFLLSPLSGTLHLSLPYDTKEIHSRVKIQGGQLEVCSEDCSSLFTTF